MRKKEFVMQIETIGKEMGYNVVVSEIFGHGTVNFIKDKKGSDVYIDMYADTYMVRTPNGGYHCQYTETHNVFGSGNDFDNLSFLQYNATLYTVKI